MHSPNDPFYFSITLLLLRQMSKSTALLLLLAAVAVVATPVVRVAVVIAAAASGSATPKSVNASATYYCTGGHIFASAICPYQIHLKERGGFTVGAVSGVTQEFVLFDIGRNTSAKAIATSLAIKIPRGDYGNFSAAIVTTARSLGDAKMWSAANVAVGQQMGLGNNTGPMTLLNIGIADPTQFADPTTGAQLQSQSFGSLVRNDFGLIVSKLAQALYAKEKISTGVPLTFTVLSGSTASGLAVATDVYNSVLASEAGLAWYGQNYIWPDRSPATELQDSWDTRIIPWAQDIAALAVKPDVVIVAGLTTEVNVSRALMAAWRTAPVPWRAKLTCFAGGSIPDVITDDFVDTVLVSQYHRTLRGKERDVKDIPGLTKLWASDPILGIQSPEVFARDIAAVTAVGPAVKLSPVGPAIGSVPLLSIKEAMQIECRDIVLIEECNGRRIAAGLSRIKAPSPFGLLSYANGQIDTGTFFASQIADDLTQTFLTSESQNGTLNWSRSWQELGVPLYIKLDPFFAVFSIAVCFSAGVGAMIQLGWVILAKKSTNPVKRVENIRILATSLTMAGVVFCGQWIFAYATSLTNLPSDQMLLGFKGMWFGLHGLICAVGATLTVAGVFYVITPHDARVSDEYGSTGGRSSSRASLSKSTSSAAFPVLEDGSKARCYHSRVMSRTLGLGIAMTPLTIAIVSGSVFCLLAFDADGVMSLSSRGVVGGFLLCWACCVAAPMCLFQIRSGWRTVFGGFVLALAVWLTQVVVFETAEWKRNITLRVSLGSTSLEPKTMFGIVILLLIVLMGIVQFSTNIWFKGDATQLAEFVRDADDRAETFWQRLLNAHRDNMAAVLRASVNIDGTTPEYPGVFHEIAVEEKHRERTLEATKLTLDAVVRYQPALMFFFDHATPYTDRSRVEFLVLISVFETYIHMEGPAGQPGHQELMPEVITVARKLRKRMLEPNNVNVESSELKPMLDATEAVADGGLLLSTGEEAKKIDPMIFAAKYDSMISKVHAVLPNLATKVMTGVRTNQWARLCPWHANHLAVLVRGSQEPAVTLVPSVITHTVGTATRQRMHRVKHSIEMTPDTHSRGIVPAAAFAAVRENGGSESKERMEGAGVRSPYGATRGIENLLPGAVADPYMVQSPQPSASASEAAPAAGTTSH